MERYQGLENGEYKDEDVSVAGKEEYIVAIRLRCNYRNSACSHLPKPCTYIVMYYEGSYVQHSQEGL